MTIQLLFQVMSSRKKKRIKNATLIIKKETSVQTIRYVDLVISETSW